MHHAYNIVAGLPPCTDEFADEGLPSVAREALQVLRSMYQVFNFHNIFTGFNLHAILTRFNQQYINQL